MNGTLKLQQLLIELYIIEWTGTTMTTRRQRKVLVMNEKGYINYTKPYEVGRVRQEKDLCGKYDDADKNNNEVLDNIRELKDCIKSEIDLRFHSIRTQLGSSHITTK